MSGGIVCSCVFVITSRKDMFFVPVDLLGGRISKKQLDIKTHSQLDFTSTQIVFL